MVGSVGLGRAVGREGGDVSGGGEVGSRQPHQPGSVQVLVGGGAVGEGSLQPPKKPGEVQVVEVVGSVVVVVTGSVGSLQPKKRPGDVHVVEVVMVVVGDVGVGVGTAVMEGEAGVVVDVLSLQPNQPGVLQVVVVAADVLVLVAVPVVVVVSSRHPHQPGVLHVSVLVRVLVDVGFVFVVVVSELLLS